MTWSTGIGCGAIIDGRPILGKDGNAHEIGHTVVDIEGKMVCACGKKGHWEAYCCGKNIPNFARFLVKKYKLSSEFDTRDLTTEKLFSLAKKDKSASRIVNEILGINGIGIANIINVYDPELIVIGGSVMLNNKWALNTIKRHAKSYKYNRMPRIKTTKLGENATLYGAMAIASKKIIAPAGI